MAIEEVELNKACDLQLPVPVHLSRLSSDTTKIIKILPTTMYSRQKFV
jgi:hypothetical protein